MRSRELTEHDRGSFIEETTASHAKDGMLALPFRGQISFAENWQILIRRIFRHRLYRRRSFHVGSRIDLWHRTVILFRNIIGKFADRVSDLCQTFRIERAAFGIDLSQLQSL